MPKSAPSGRALAHVKIMVGMLPIEVSLYNGTDKESGVKRNQYVVTESGDHPVGNKSYDKETGEDVAYSEIVKKIQTEYGPVFVEDDEIENLFEITPDTVVVKKFQPLHLFHQGHYVPKGIAFVEPIKDKTKKGGVNGYNKVSLKTLTTLLEAMRGKGACALVEVTTRGVPKPAMLLPDGTLWFVYHTNELRERRELPEFDVAAADVDMMSNFIDVMFSTEVQDLTDERSALIQAFADEKAAAGDFGKPEPVAVEHAEPEADVDMMALLMASVEAVKAEAS